MIALLEHRPLEKRLNIYKILNSNYNSNKMNIIKRILDYKFDKKNTIVFDKFLNKYIIIEI